MTLLPEMGGIVPMISGTTLDMPWGSRDAPGAAWLSTAAEERDPRESRSPIRGAGAQASFHQPSSGAGGGHLARAAFMIPTSNDGVGAGSFLVTVRIDRLRSFVRVRAGPPDPRSEEEEQGRSGRRVRERPSSRVRP